MRLINSNKNKLNSSKNKLNSKIIYNFHPNLNTHIIELSNG